MNKFILILLLFICSMNFVSAEYNDTKIFLDKLTNLSVSDFFSGLYAVTNPFEGGLATAKSVSSDVMDLAFKNYIRESANRKEQVLEDTQVLELKKQILFEKLNYVLELFLYVFVILKELLLLLFYFFEMYLILLLFLKIIPFIINWLINAVSGGYTKIKKGDTN